ncbi:MAG TPA: helix-turn-helix domain-containing protein [Candidatus Micrarchaeaceae archaeon]|nr:helix-turn-helix domain-containing protein [Candidatus Micrarchaeaceae archaeon]
MQSALELYAKHGYDQTTVAEIAQRAGLTERTFFRHFVDKREVLFAGSDDLRDLLVGAVAGAPASAPPMAAVTAGLLAAGAAFNEDRRGFSMRRQSIIAANAELRERELIKLATLASAIADTLRQRGVSDPAASLTAEAGIAVFHVAFHRWVDASNELGWDELVRSSLAELRVLVSS